MTGAQLHWHGPLWHLRGFLLRKTQMEYRLKNSWCSIFLAVAIAAPGTASAQTICEGLTTILTASREELQFYTVPGAICKTSGLLGSDFGCIWQKPGRSGNGQTFRQWVNSTIRPEMKKLAGAIQQCIKQKAIPFEWYSFEEDITSAGFVRGYFVQKDTNSKRLKTIGVCFESNNKEVGTGIVLAVRFAPEGKSYCSIFW